MNRWSRLVVAIGCATLIAGGAINLRPSGSMSSVIASTLALAKTAPCAATPTSLTPPAWTAAHKNNANPSAPPALHAAPGSPVVHDAFAVSRDIPLPGAASRFDYQSIDPALHRLYISHMNAGTLLAFNLDNGRVIAEVAGLPRVTGVWAVPPHHHLYASAAGAHEVDIIDDRSLTIIARVGGVKFPDGIAYAPDVDKVFVSDESGEADVVIDARTLKKRNTIDLGGEAGNTHYDSVSHCILVAVQTTNEMVAVDPVTERVMQRYAVHGVKGTHGFAIDEPGRLMFVTGEDNATLAVIDLRDMHDIQHVPVGDGPDVLAWDASRRRLYVASESGTLSSFQVAGDTLLALGTYKAPHAHTVAVDPRTHRIYLPLQDIGGRPVLRVLEQLQ